MPRPVPGKNAFPTVLAIKKMRMPLHLGVGEKERARKQDVLVDLRFYLSQPLSSGASDTGEYLCYHGVSEKIRDRCRGKEFRLIEYLAMEIYRLVRKEIPARTRIWVRLTKPRILLPYVEDGASFTHTDLPVGAWVAPD